MSVPGPGCPLWVGLTAHTQPMGRQCGFIYIDKGWAISAHFPAAAWIKLLCFKMKLWEANIAVNPSTAPTGISLFYNHSWRRKWQPTLVFLSGESIDRGTWQAIAHGVARVRHNLVTKPTTIIIHFYDHFFFPHKVGPSLFKRIRLFSVHFAFGHKHYLKGKILSCIRLVVCSL